VRTWVRVNYDGETVRATVGAAAPYGRKLPREASASVEVPGEKLPEALRKQMDALLKDYGPEAETEAQMGAASGLMAARAAQEE
jgi:hypothetical protein